MLRRRFRRWISRASMRTLMLSCCFLGALAMYASTLTSSKKSQKTHNNHKVISNGFSSKYLPVVVYRWQKSFTYDDDAHRSAVRSPPLLMVVHSPFFPLASGASSLLVALSLLLAPLLPTGTLKTAATGSATRMGSKRDRQHM